MVSYCKLNYMKHVCKFAFRAKKNVRKKMRVINVNHGIFTDDKLFRSMENAIVKKMQLKPSSTPFIATKFN